MLMAHPRSAPLKTLLVKLLLVFVICSFGKQKQEKVMTSCLSLEKLTLGLLRNQGGKMSHLLSCAVEFSLEIGFSRVSWPCYDTRAAKRIVPGSS